MFFIQKNKNILFQEDDDDHLDDICTDTTLGPVHDDIDDTIDLSKIVKIDYNLVELHEKINRNY